MTHAELEEITRRLLAAVEYLAAAVALYGQADACRAHGYVRQVVRDLDAIDHPPAAPPPPPEPAPPNPPDRRVPLYVVGRDPLPESKIYLQGVREGHVFVQDKKMIRGFAAGFGETDAETKPFSELSYVRVVMVDPENYNAVMAASP